MVVGRRTQKDLFHKGLSDEEHKAIYFIKDYRTKNTKDLFHKGLSDEEHKKIDFIKGYR